LPIIFFCSKCGREIRVRSICAGRKGHCVDCGEEIIVPDIDPIIPRRLPMNDPAGDGEPKTRIVESSSEIPSVNYGFMDDGEAQQETTRR
jgi:DNA-directed RNA polymerase subunit RPC12/RpoP